MSSVNLETTKCLLHFNDFLKDEIGLEAWTKENTNVTFGDIIKFGHQSLYPNTGALLGSNNTGIWSLNSNGDYEIEFFVYPTAHGGTRYLLRLMEQGNSSPILMLSLTTSGYLQFISTSWDITTAITGSTALTINTWYHVLIRVSDQTLKVFLDGLEEISANLPNNITLDVEQVRLGYFSYNAYKYYLDEFAFRHSARSNNPTIPVLPYFLTSDYKHSLRNTKCLLHFDDLTKDEIAIETWSKGNTNVTSGDIIKFGHQSLYPNTGALLGTNNTGIWSLNSNGDYEIEFFVYPTAHGGNRYLFRLMKSTTAYLTLRLNANGTIRFACSNWGCSGIDGTKVLAVNEWQHIMLRISNQTAKVFINEIKDISIELNENVKLNITQARIGYFNNISYDYYIDEFLFRHSASTVTPTIPKSPYSFSVYANHAKRNFGTIKSLLHFDYPYFNEPNDGLGDEIGIETWSTSNTNVKLYGNVIPKAGTFAPKFGYRCLYAYGAVTGTNNTGIWNINSSENYEIEFFLNPIQHGSDAKTRRLLRLREQGNTSSIFMLSLTIDGHLEFIASGWNITEAVTGTAILSVSVWHHLLIRISNQTAKVFIDGAEDISIELPSNVTLNVEQVLLGYFQNANYPFYIDEFMFKHSAGKDNPIIPTEPYNGYLDKKNIGGYGTGLDGDVTISTNTQINSYGLINAVTDNRTFNVLSWSNGTTIPDIGTEVMIHITAPRKTTVAKYPLVGLYSFAKIFTLNGTVVVLDRDITTRKGDDFTLTNELLSNYYIQVITMPNYNNLILNSGYTIRPLSWDSTKGGGIIAFRCVGDCTINGKILTSSYGLIRYDMIQMTHSQMIDRFIITKGGGIFIACGGTLFIDENARLGASWSGLDQDYNGAAGYGGSGIVGASLISGGVGGGAGGRGGIWFSRNITGQDTSSSSVNSLGGNVGCSGLSTGGYYGGCGGGGGCGGKGGDLINADQSSTNTKSAGAGGGCQGETGGHAGENKTTGNYGCSGHPSYGCNGGHGYNGGKSIYNVEGFSGGGGGGAGGNGGNSYSSTGGSAGSCIVIVSEKASIPQASISTGGQRGTYQLTTFDSGSTAGAGGTGFCYIAAGELLDG